MSNNPVTRKTIIAELLLGCPDEAIGDHFAIAGAVERGESLLHLLAMPELDRWPDTYVWLSHAMKEVSP